MKQVVILISGIITVLLFATTGMAERLLTAADLKELFNDRTFTVTIGPGKKHGAEEPFKLFTSSMGVAKAQNDEDGEQTRMWTVSDEGLFCFSRSLSRRNQGRTCGMVVEIKSGQYNFYDSDEIRKKSGRLVGMKKKDLWFTLTNAKAGNHL